MINCLMPTGILALCLALNKFTEVTNELNSICYLDLHEFSKRWLGSHKLANLSVAVPLLSGATLPTNAPAHLKMLTLAK